MNKKPETYVLEGYSPPTDALGRPMLPLNHPAGAMVDTSQPPESQHSPPAQPTAWDFILDDGDLWDTNIRKLRKLLAQAHPGPWGACGENRGGCQCNMIWSLGGPNQVVVAETTHTDPDMPSPTPEQAKANALLVAAAITALPALLDELERLRRT